MIVISAVLPGQRGRNVSNRYQPWYTRTGICTGIKLVLAACALNLIVAPKTPAEATNYVKNPNFSAGLADYTTGVVSTGFFPGYPHFDTLTSPACYAGPITTYLGLDVPGGADGYVQQQVTLPATPTTFSFTTWGNLDPVTATISVIDGGVVTVLDSYTPPPLEASETTCSGNIPIVKSYSLKAFAGQTITIQLEATSEGDDGTFADFTNLSIGAPPLVQGTAHDVVLNFPNRTSPSVTNPLAGATVRLLDDTNTQVATTTTDTSGNYELDGTVPSGTYTVEFSKNANLYSSASNGYSQAPVKQVRTVTLDGTAPVTVNVDLPVSIVSETATHEYALNNWPPFQGLYPTLEHYNTTAIEAQINAIVSQNPPPDFNGPPFNTPDDWNSLIRIDAAMETLQERSQDAVLFCERFREVSLAFRHDQNLQTARACFV